jgi:hypothetical protein
MVSGIRGSILSSSCARVLRTGYTDTGNLLASGSSH